MRLHPHAGDQTWKEDAMNSLNQTRLTGTNPKTLASSLGARAALLTMLTSLGLVASSCSRVFVHIEPKEPIIEKRAILVLPGLNMLSKGYRAAKDWYPRQAYDVFIPEYLSKDGLDGSVNNLEKFIDDNGLKAYKEVYAFTYLMGAWTLNRYLEVHEFPNLKKIVYVRSPYQEQAPRIVLENIPLIIHMLFGRAVDDLRDTPYPPIEKGRREIGIIVENRAAPYIRRHRDQLTPLSEKDWTPEAFNQPHDDLMYVFLHHNEMYHRFDVIGEELLSFFETGRFTSKAARSPIDRDPFVR